MNSFAAVNRPIVWREVKVSATRKSQIFPPLCILRPSPLKGFLSEVGIGARSQKLESGYQMVKRFQDKFSRLDTIPACDGETVTDIFRRQRPRYAERRAG